MADQELYERTKTSNRLKRRGRPFQADERALLQTILGFFQSRKKEDVLMN